MIEGKGYVVWFRLVDHYSSFAKPDFVDMKMITLLLWVPNCGIEFAWSGRSATIFENNIFRISNMDLSEENSISKFGQDRNILLSLNK